MNTQQSEWDKSYNRMENWVLSPKEELVKFLSRFIRRRTGFNTFEDKIDMSGDVKAFDLGCGIGRQTILLKEFGFNAFGVDLSQQAINTAKSLCKDYGFSELEANFRVADINSNVLPFDDDFFKVSISDCVLDSMHFDLAKKYVKEVDRITKGHFYCSLISGGRYKEGGFDGEVIVEDAFEKGTVQSYFSEAKITELFAETNFKVIWSALIREDYMTSGTINDRYYVVVANN